MTFQRLPGARTRAERIQAALVAHPEIREIAIETNDRLFDEAAERFAAALGPGVTMRLDVAHAVGVVAAGAVDSRAGDDRFRAAREVVIAGYLWRMCEVDPELMRLRAGEASGGFGEAPAAARFRELRSERPAACATALVARAAAESVEAGDPVHLQSPGGPAFGRRFLGRGAALSRATVPAAGGLGAAEHDALFMSGVCLRDVEPALAGEPPTERVHVGITPAAPAPSS
jgi:hypothetical protein